MTRAVNTALAGSGGVLQVVQTVKTDTAVVSGGVTYTIASVTITPASTSSRILLMSHVTGYQPYDTALYFTRNGTKIGAGDTAGSRTTGFAEMGAAQRTNESGTSSGFFLDAPATTSAITYAVVLFNASATAYINRSQNDDNASFDSRTTSTITVLEIAG